jgi:hypothetical protein
MEENMEKVSGLVLCSVCNRMFSAHSAGEVVGTNFKPQVLPCGHKAASLTFSAGGFKAAEKAEKMLQWLDQNSLIREEAVDAAELAGGDFSCMDSFRLPVRDLTYEEKEDLGIW